MSPIKTKLAKTAVKSTARHSARGAVSKLRRDPARTGTLLGIGCLIGMLLGAMLARTGRSSPESVPSGA